MTASWPPDVDVLDVIEDWVRSRRWFPASDDSALEVIANIDLSTLSAPLDWDQQTALEPVWISLVRVGTAVLQIPLVLTETPPHSAAGVIDRVGGAWLVDGPQHPAFLRAWIRRAAAERGFIPEAGDPVDLERGLLAQTDAARPVTSEQTNSSIIFPGPGPRAVLKIFRIVSPGVHPDLEIPRALATTGWKHVPAPLVHLGVPLPPIPGGDATPGLAVSGIASTLVEDAHDGFDFFVGLAARNEDAREAARDLGTVIAQMHEHLEQAFGTGTPSASRDLADRVSVNLDAAAAEVRELTPELVAGLKASLAPLNIDRQLPAPIRIHGDLHLGQTLLGHGGWHVLDFEGEPLRPLADRRQPDLALRDVAGVLRSIDYASAQAHRSGHSSRMASTTTAEIPVVGKGPGPATPTDPVWRSRAEDAFIDGYTDGHGFDDAQTDIVRALMIEKAAYEVVYEHRLRQSWLPIPLGALEQLADVSR